MLGGFRADENFHVSIKKGAQMQQSLRGELIKSVVDQIRHMGLRYPEESGDFALDTPRSSSIALRRIASWTFNFFPPGQQSQDRQTRWCCVLNYITFLSHHVPRNLVAPLSGVHELILHHVVGCDTRGRFFLKAMEHTAPSSFQDFADGGVLPCGTIPSA